MRGGNIYLWSYLNGIFASLGGCTLPILSLIVARVREEGFNKWKFILEFFLAQVVLFGILNITVATIYTVFEEIQPILLLIASLITFILATSIYLNKPIPLPSAGGIYGLALSPCSIGFAISTAATSTSYLPAFLNSILFAGGVVTPIVLVAFMLGSVEPIMKRSRMIEKASILLLYLVSFYLAYLSGSSWRWIP